MKRIHIERLRRELLRIYPRCSGRELEDLVQAVKNDKHWNVKVGSRDAVYAVILSRARRSASGMATVQATGVGRIAVSPGAAPFCRMGRVLVAVKRGRGYEGRSVMPWPTLLKIMRTGYEHIPALLESGRLPTFIRLRDLVEGPRRPAKMLEDG